ncbi:MAG: hypothetical protein EBZ36_05560 [Acidobacteria bacterium]|nr:hypothetical protein [Acidobacteriota bacterium]
MCLPLLLSGNDALPEDVLLLLGSCFFQYSYLICIGCIFISCLNHHIQIWILVNLVCQLHITA